ncbi:lariat debranching enzyme [Paracoccidioides lutzii Pb01]|uniref:Lariat debranching enzyme n=1 Tax=Paracoccidioides lutzii (strain ATCC MYA-826 / Pb01) TaxID=502779 RepID=C1H331_PARBA|nr:lariat debranching enzyme [Paracoccidioides lutzii Pb01]EEH34125.2 lariat debranching enzyme [Paracoccidioides lutzii Pb01]
MQSSNASQSLRVALEGCGHGKLHDIYASVNKAAKLKGWNGVDLLIIGGDFQASSYSFDLQTHAVRNSYDLSCMSVPQKYKKIGDFHEYYSGSRVAPYLTIFVGGNHEASNHLFELYYGGWVAPNIYYLGAANVIRCGPLRIAGISGIWKGYDYRKPHFERLPYNRDDKQSIYHVRELDVRKLLQIRTQVDLGLSHDWPQGIEWHGNFKKLFKMKPLFEADAQAGKLGSVAARYVLDRLRPPHWFSAHLHCKYTARLVHGDYKPPVLSDRLGPNRESQMTPLGDDVVVSPSTTKEPPTPFGSAQLSASQYFHTVASKQDAEDEARLMQEATEHERQIEASLISRPEVNCQFTWKSVGVVDSGLKREIQDITKVGFDKEQPSIRDEAAQQKGAVETPGVKNTDEIDIDLDTSSETSEKSGTMDSKKSMPNIADEMETNCDSSPQRVEAENISSTLAPDNVGEAAQSDEVPTDVRDQLPASFRKPNQMSSLPPDQLPIFDPKLPETIKNTETNFIALDKCEGKRKFIQLIEYPTISLPDGGAGGEESRPYQLKYDKEWLAITRAFADDLTLGDPSVSIPPNKGDARYKPEILSAEEWVEENIVKRGKMVVPHNFSITAPVYDPAVPITTNEMPPEYTNPQTAEFCKLLGIENKFHISDKERRARIDAGPLPEEERRFRPQYGRFGKGKGRGGGRGSRNEGGRWQGNGGRGKRGREGRGGFGGRS